jgi:environmental stress-induced protein Ves
MFLHRPLQIDGRVSRVVRLSDRVTMPWKNGGGITHELLRVEGAAGFDVRLSIAEVATEGPFSRFPGVDRVILLLEGEQCVLTRDDGTVVRLTPGRPFAFLGEDSWGCTLPSGPVRDFNVMTSRASTRAAVLVLGPGRVDATYALALASGRVGDTRVEAGELLVLDGPVASEVPVVAVTIT